jgi:hypothetical protein
VKEDDDAGGDEGDMKEGATVDEDRGDEEEEANFLNRSFILCCR